MHGTEENFLRLVRENDARLRRICRVYAPDADAAQDLYQEILVQLWRSLSSFRGESSTATWLYRVALNTALTQRRKQRARPEVPLASEVTTWPDSRPSPEERLEAEQARESLLAAVGKLGEVDKALVAMYLDDCSYREMAEVLGITESNVGVKLHRIKQRLAAEMTEGVR